MKSEQQIKDHLINLLNDDRVFNKDGSNAKAATTDENAALALIQVEVESKVRALKWVLSD